MSVLPWPTDEEIAEADRLRCECGHGPEHHVAGGFRQNTRTGKSHWKRHCHGHKGYDTLSGETPCRCKGYRQNEKEST